MLEINDWPRQLLYKWLLPVPRKVSRKLLTKKCKMCTDHIVLLVRISRLVVC